MYQEIVGIILDHVGMYMTGEEAEALATEILAKIMHELDWLFSD